MPDRLFLHPWKSSEGRLQDEERQGEERIIAGRASGGCIMSNQRAQSPPQRSQRPTKMIPLSTSSLQLNWMLFLAIIFISVQSTQAQCSLCLDDSFQLPTDIFLGDVTCPGLAESFAGIAGEPCSAAQLTYGVYCGCNSALVDVGCRVCGDSLLPNPGLPIVYSAEVDSCIDLEYLANLDPNVDGENSCETIQSSPQAALCCAAIPTASPAAGTTTSRPTPGPTRGPTRNPTPTPTRAPTHTPTRAPTHSPTHSPTLAPTISPSTLPTRAPTVVPSNSPTSSMTIIPSIAPSLFSLPPFMRPTSKPSLRTTAQPSVSSSKVPMSIPAIQTPTSMPTLPEPTSFPSLLPTNVPDVQVGASFTGIQLKLQGIGTLTQTAQENFESALQGWYASLYEEDRRRMLHSSIHGFSSRLLKSRKSLRLFRTRVLYKDQFTAEDGDVIVVYDQTLSFVQNIQEDVLDPRLLLLEPFEDETAVQQLLNRLRVSDSFFEAVETPINAPLVPPADDTNKSGDEDNRSNPGLILGIIAGVIAIVLVTVVFVHRSRPRQEAKENGAIEAQDDDKVTAMPTADYEMSSPLDEPGKPQAATPESSSEEKLQADEGRAKEEHFSTDPSRGRDPQDDDLKSLPTTEFEKSRDTATGPHGEDSRTVASTGAIGQKTDWDISSSWMGVLGLETPAVKEQAEAPQVETIEVIVPPGKLGVVIDTPSEGPPTVFAVKDTSPLFGKVQVGDFLIKVDDDDVSTFSAVKVSKLIGRKAKNPERKFVLTRGVHDFDDE